MDHIVEFYVLININIKFSIHSTKSFSVCNFKIWKLNFKYYINKIIIDLQSS